MGFRSFKCWHAYCDICGGHEFAVAATRNDLVAGIRAKGWSYSAKTRRVTCSACKATRAAGKGEAR